MVNVLEGNMRKHEKAGKKISVFFFARKLQTWKKNKGGRESPDLVIAGFCRSTGDPESMKCQSTVGLGPKHPSYLLRNFLKGYKL